MGGVGNKGGGVGRPGGPGSSGGPSPDGAGGISFSLIFEVGQYNFVSSYLLNLAFVQFSSSHKSASLIFFHHFSLTGESLHMFGWLSPGSEVFNNQNR